MLFEPKTELAKGERLMLAIDSSIAAWTCLLMVRPAGLEPATQRVETSCSDPAELRAGIQYRHFGSGTNRQYNCLLAKVSGHIDIFNKPFLPCNNAPKPPSNGHGHRAGRMSRDT